MNTLLQPGNMPPAVKYTFSHYGRRSYDSTRDIINPDEIDVTGCERSDEGLEIKFSRDGLKGVQVEESLPQEFALEAFLFLRDLYGQYAQFATCRLNVYRRDEVNAGSYELVKSYNLDFGTIQVHDDYVSIEAENTGLNAFIKSAGKTKFDIPVQEVVDEHRWEYKRLEVQANGSWTLPENYVAQYDTWMEDNVAHGCPYMRLDAFKRPPDSPPIDAGTQEQYGGGYGHDDYNDDNRGRTDSVDGVFGDMPYFFGALQDITVTVAVKFKFNASAESAVINASLVFYINRGERRVTVREYTNAESVADEVDLSVDLELAAGETVSFGFILQVGGVSYYRVDFTDFEYFRLTYPTVGKTRLIDAVNPETLLSKLVSRMSDGRYAGAEIRWRPVPTPGPTSILCAAESLRGLENANLHTSFNNFADWMRVKGYEYTVEEDGVIFMPREALFDKSAVAAEFGSGEVAGLITEAYPEYAYTSVKIGYDQYEYADDYNGRAEVNGTFEYLTGLLSQNDNVLELISPYRADAIGIEMLCWEAVSKKDNDSVKSDNDLFEVAVSNLVPAPYFNLQTYTAVQLASKGLLLFNATLCPRLLADDNASLFGVVTDTLYFSSTTSARDAALYASGQTSPLYDNVPVDTEARLFRPAAYNFAVGSHVPIAVDTQANGLVKFKYKGKDYEGFIMEGSRNLTRGTEADFTLAAI